MFSRHPGCGLLLGLACLVVATCPAGALAPVTITEHEETVTALAFSPDGSLLASGSADRTIKLCDPATGDVHRTIQHKSPILSLTFSPNGKGLASTTADDTVWLWSTATGALLWSHTGPQAGDRAPTTPCAAFSPDTRYLASGYRGGVVALYDIKTRTLKTLNIAPPTASVTAIAFSDDGKFLAATSAVRNGPRQITLWQLPPDAPPRQFAAPGLVDYLAFAAGDKLLLCAVRNGEVSAISPSDGKVRASLRHDTPSRTIVLSAKRGRLLVIGSDESRLIDIFGQAGRRLPGADGVFSAAAACITDAGALLAVCRGDQAVSISTLPLRNLEDLTLREIDDRIRQLTRRQASVDDELQRLVKRMEADRNRKEGMRAPDMGVSVRIQQLSFEQGQLTRSIDQFEALRERKVQEAKDKTLPPAQKGWDSTDLKPADCPPENIEPPLYVKPTSEDPGPSPGKAGKDLDHDEDEEDGT